MALARPSVPHRLYLMGFMLVIPYLECISSRYPHDLSLTWSFCLPTWCALPWKVNVESQSVSHSGLSNSCDPTVHRGPGSSVHGILQARILEWVAILFSRGSPKQEIEPGLMHCMQIPYHLNQVPHTEKLPWPPSFWLRPTLPLSVSLPWLIYFFTRLY